MAHTPGPWDTFDDEIVAGDGDVHIADVPLTDGIDPTQWQDNVHLIVAAPDLLAALKIAVRTIRQWHGMGMGAHEPQAWSLYQASPEMKAITAAMAKAERAALR